MTRELNNGVVKEVTCKFIVVSVNCTPFLASKGIRPKSSSFLTACLLYLKVSKVNYILYYCNFQVHSHFHNCNKPSTVLATDNKGREWLDFSLINRTILRVTCIIIYTIKDSYLYIECSNKAI